MLQENNTKVLIFGYGSVGKKYANYFLKKKFQVIIFDPYKKRDNSKITIIRSYKDLLNLKKKIYYSVICSLAGDHFLNFKIATKLGIKNILIEKPLTNNFTELSKIKNIIKKKKINLHSNHSWELYDLDLFLKNIQQKYKMGNPLTFLSYGGAFCISTGAIHFFNIILKIFKININDVEIFSNIYKSDINPRSNKYKTFGGIVSLSNKNKNIIFNYSNFSKIKTIQTIIYKFHKINFYIDGKYNIYRTPKKNDNKKITYLENCKLIKKGKLYKKNNIDLAADFLIRKKIKIGFEYSYNSLIILFSIMVSDKMKKTIKVKDTINYLKKRSIRFLFT